MKTASFVLCSAALLFSQLAHAKPDQDKGLPPGLAKKLDKGQPLPPGWQKKLSKPDTDGIITIQIEGTVIELFEHSREIVRILEGRR